MVKNKKESKYLHWLSAITLSSAMVLMLYFAYLLLWPFKILQFEKDYSSTLKTQYTSGEVLTYKQHYTKYKAVEGKVIQAFVDGIVFQLPDRMTDNPVGHYEAVNTSVVIPASLPSGKYRLATTVVYHVNAFRDIRYTAKSNLFTVHNLNDIDTDRK